MRAGYDILVARCCHQASLQLIIVQIFKSAEAMKMTAGPFQTPDGLGCVTHWERVHYSPGLFINAGYARRETRPSNGW